MLNVICQGYKFDNMPIKVEKIVVLMQQIQRLSVNGSSSS